MCGRYGGRADKQRIAEWLHTDSTTGRVGRPRFFACVGIDGHYESEDGKDGVVTTMARRPKRVRCSAVYAFSGATSRILRT